MPAEPDPTTPLPALDGVCGVENCGTELGAPRDRHGWCERCADEIEALERASRADEVG